MLVAPWPSNTVQIKAEIISGIGRPVEFWTVYSSYACSGCTLDPVTNTSTDSFCEICSGNYWIPLYSGDTLRAHVTWKYADQQQYLTGGDVMLGDCQVKVILESGIDSLVSNAEYVIVDDRKMNIDRITYRGAVTPDRVILDLKEEEKDNG